MTGVVFPEQGERGFEQLNRLSVMVQVPCAYWYKNKWMEERASSLSSHLNCLPKAFLLRHVKFLPGGAVVSGLKSSLPSSCLPSRSWRLRQTRVSLFNNDTALAINLAKHGRSLCIQWRHWDWDEFQANAMPT